MVAMVTTAMELRLESKRKEGGDTRAAQKLGWREKAKGLVKWIVSVGR